MNAVAVAAVLAGARGSDAHPPRRPPGRRQADAGAGPAAPSHRHRSQLAAFGGEVAGCCCPVVQLARQPAEKLPDEFSAETPDRDRLRAEVETMTDQKQEEQR